MKPKYSILLCNQDLEIMKANIEEWLKSGIKVFWFGKKEECELLCSTQEEFIRHFLLQIYVTDLKERFVIEDGIDTDNQLKLLADNCKMFNEAQYNVEHCNVDDHVIVQASAGTGKTTVMIDRVMYLMHTVPDLRMSEIFMITFTNDAANQMNHRLQEMLMTRYKLTGNQKYLTWLEEQSQMNISTIHSFAYSLLKEYGINHSFTRNLSIRSLIYERKELIKDIIDNKVDENSPVWKQLGMSFYRAKSLIDDYWKTIANSGISHQELMDFKWGFTDDIKSETIQKLLKTVFPDLDEEYFNLKKELDAVSVSDIVRDLYEVLMSDNVPQTDLVMKYLFIDEFQDTDLSQIRIAVRLVQLLDARLFVVGDVKQSIYRFRGATEKSFDMLQVCLDTIGITNVATYMLYNNYRTAFNLMDWMNIYFKTWHENSYLQYEAEVKALNTIEGTKELIQIERNPETKRADETEEREVIAQTASDALTDLVSRIENNKRKAKAKDRVVLLTRTNFELNVLANILKSKKIPVSVVRDGSFYSSEAVRDFYALVGSFLFSDEPKHVFNYLLTPYAGNIETMDINLMEQLNGDSDKLVEYLSHFLDQTNWQDYYKQLRLRPVMAVIKSIIDVEPIIENFVASSKQRKLDQGWDEKRCNAATRTEAMQYQADLDKLIEILQRNFNGDKLSLYDLYHFLQLQIATNRTESEPVIEVEDDYSSVLCMTVHKAKGLEFDTVIIPFTDRYYLKCYVNEEFLIDPETNDVGWLYKPPKKDPMKNSNYDELDRKDNVGMEKEETRLLYVAMTRAINKLVCIVVTPTREHSWGHLIEMGGVDNE